LFSYKIYNVYEYSRNIEYNKHNNSIGFGDLYELFVIVNPKNTIH